MDWTIPYTFYPMALPGWISWVLFLIAIAGGCFTGFFIARRRGWYLRILALLTSTVAFLFASMVISMVITFFVHDL
jgi:formate-dependent nitrite reductase membrane component NrfD